MRDVCAGCATTTLIHRNRQPLIRLALERNHQSQARVAGVAHVSVDVSVGQTRMRLDAVDPGGAAAIVAKRGRGNGHGLYMRFSHVVTLGSIEVLSTNTSARLKNLNIRIMNTFIILLQYSKALLWTNFRFRLKLSKWRNKLSCSFLSYKYGKLL